jgi:hypothetical protein
VADWFSGKFLWLFHSGVSDYDAGRGLLSIGYPLAMTAGKQQCGKESHLFICTASRFNELLWAVLTAAQWEENGEGQAVGFSRVTCRLLASPLGLEAAVQPP